MVIQLVWADSEHMALHYQFPENWTWDDFYHVKAESDALMDTCDHDVALLFNMTSTKQIPAGALTSGPQPAQMSAPSR